MDFVIRTHPYVARDHLFVKLCELMDLNILGDHHLYGLWLTKFGYVDNLLRKQSCSLLLSKDKKAWRLGQSSQSLTRHIRLSMNYKIHEFHNFVKP